MRKFSEFNDVLSAFFKQCTTGTLSIATNWVGARPAAETFFNTAAAYFDRSTVSPSSPAIPFEPFAQKLTVPDGSEILFHADLHGDIRSLLGTITWLNDNGYLDGFTIVRPDFYVIFLGDYTDRGSYGIEVLYTLLRLKLANPDHFFLCRGNHEEVSLQSRYGFIEEGHAKYGDEFDARRLERAYDFLPVVIYAGAGGSVLQCHHGGMEPGFNPQRLLNAPGSLTWQFLGSLNQQTYLRDHPEFFSGSDAPSRRTALAEMRNFRPETPILPSVIGFMWNDFSILSGEPQFAVDPGRAFVYGPRPTQFLLRSFSTTNRTIQAVFRGHQQSSLLNPMMRRLLASRGVFRHWQAADNPRLRNASISDLAAVLERGDERSIPTGSVWTFNVSPDSVYGEGCGYTFDSFGILKTAADFTNWRLRVVNIPVRP